MKEEADEEIQDTVAAEEVGAGDKSMDMEKTGFSAAVAAGADTAAANVNWLIDIDKAEEQPKIKFDNQEEEKGPEEPAIKHAITPVIETEDIEDVP